MLRFAIVAAVLAVSSAMQYKNCATSGAVINAVVASDCDPATDICSVHRGSEYKGYINFTALHDANQAHAVLHGGLGFLSLPWPVSPADACAGSLTPGCPIKAGQNYTYKLDMHCPSIAPAGARVSAKWELKNEHRHDILCFVLPINIV